MDGVPPAKSVIETESFCGLKKILRNQKEKMKLEDLLSNSQTSKLFSVQDDMFAAEIIQHIDPKVWKINSRDETTGNNLLHFFINKGFYSSLEYLLDSKSNQEDLRELVFQENKAGNTPLMSSLTQKMDEISKKLLQIMKTDPERLPESTYTPNKRKMTVLHLCAENGQNEFLLEILEDLNPAKLEESIFVSNKEQRTVLDMCKDEQTLLHILERLIEEASPTPTDIEERLKYCDYKKRNILNHWARNNLHRPIDYLMKHLSSETFKEMMLAQSSNGNNPMMVSALHSKKESLERFLHHICFHRDLYNEDDFENILHARDIQGDTLLALVLQQSGRLDAAKNIILDMEKKFHGAETDTDTNSNEDAAKGKRELLECLKENLKPSVEVQKAINDIENSLPKSFTQKAGIAARVFLKSLLIPVLVLFFDIGFDAILVGTYWDYENDDSQYNHEMCRNTTINSTTLRAHNQTSLHEDIQCEEEKQSEMPFVCIPLALDKFSRFNYSLVFVISPWVFYYIEYCQSVQWEKSVEVKRRKNENNTVNSSLSGDSGKKG